MVELVDDVQEALVSQKQEAESDHANWPQSAIGERDISLKTGIHAQVVELVDTLS